MPEAPTLKVPQAELQREPEPGRIGPDPGHRHHRLFGPGQDRRHRRHPRHYVGAGPRQLSGTHDRSSEAKNGTAQNFSEGFLLPGILEADMVVTATGDGAVAFVDADDIAAVAAAALTEEATPWPSTCSPA